MFCLLSVKETKQKMKPVNEVKPLKTTKHQGQIVVFLKLFVKRVSYFRKVYFFKVKFALFA